MNHNLLLKIKRFSIAWFYIQMFAVVLAVIAFIITSIIVFDNDLYGIYGLPIVVLFLAPYLLNRLSKLILFLPGKYSYGNYKKLLIEIREFKPGSEFEKHAKEVFVTNKERSVRRYSIFFLDLTIGLLTEFFRKKYTINKGAYFIDESSKFKLFIYTLIPFSSPFSKGVSELLEFSVFIHFYQYSSDETKKGMENEYTDEKIKNHKKTSGYAGIMLQCCLRKNSFLTPPAVTYAEYKEFDKDRMKL